jgi:hypothetical protein
MRGIRLAIAVALVLASVPAFAATVQIVALGASNTTRKGVGATGASGGGDAVEIMRCHSGTRALARGPGIHIPETVVMDSRFAASRRPGMT